MYRILLASLLTIGVFDGSTSQEDSYHGAINNNTSFDIGKNDTRIVGGLNAEMGSIRHQVSLRLLNSAHVCGGSIIDIYWVLTAAHCIDGIDVRYIVAGTIYLNSGGVQLDVDKMIKHHSYDRNTISNDLGLIKTLQPFVYGPYIRPILLPLWNIDVGSTGIVSGWGFTSYPGSVPNVLQILTVRIISNTQCANALGSFPIQSSHLCTYPEVGKGTCSGDSGGPLTSYNRLHGVVSFANLCARGTPDGYTRVYDFIFWILRTKITN